MLSLKVSTTAFTVLLLLVLTAGAIAAPPLSAGGQTLTITQGQTATLHAASVNGVAYQWLKNGVFISGATQNNYVVSTEGSYQVMSTNSENCNSQLSDPVTVIVQPAATPYADVAISITSVMNSTNMDDPFSYTIMIKNNGPVTATDVNVQNHIPDKVSFQKMAPPAKGTAEYSDFNNNITWKLSQLDNGETASLSYMVKAVAAGTISNTASVSSQPADPNLNNNIASTTQLLTALHIPNVFTPNGDGVNDVFEIPGLASYTTNELTIVNRWGATVYQRKDYKGDWDGSGLNEGTYFYLLKVQTPNGKWDIYKGYVTLLRAKLN